jgi:integrase
VQTHAYRLEHIARHADLNNPATVETFIAGKVANNYKDKLSGSYLLYCQYYKIEWTKPSYEKQQKMPRLPTEEQLNKFIAKAGNTLSLKLSLSKETGIRPIELHALKVKDLDTERNTINIATAKGGAPRVLPISKNLKDRLQIYIIKNNRNLNDTIFRSNARKYGNDFRDMRNRLAKRENDPLIKTVRLYDFRHFYGTMMYHKYQSIVETAALMGHRNVQTTMTYMHLDRLIQLQTEDGFVCKTAQTIEESKKLIESGFDYVTEQDGIKLYRKRK